jgi:hypothetical protein
MHTIKEYHLVKRIEALTEKNTSLSKKCELFRKKNIDNKKNIDTLNLKQQTKVKVVVGFLLDGDLKLTDQQVADKLFVDIAYIKNMKSAIRSERK